MAGVTEFNSKENLISQIRKRDTLPDVPISVLVQKQKKTRKNELGIRKAGMYKNRPATLKTGKTLHSHRFKGGKVDTVLTRQGEVLLDSGNSKIPCGGFIAFENTIYRRISERQFKKREKDIRHLERRLEKINNLLQAKRVRNISSIGLGKDNTKT